MAGAVRNDLVSKLRLRLQDERASVAAFSLRVTSPCKSSYLEITNGQLTITSEQPTQIRPTIRYNLSDPGHSTVGRLLRIFQDTEGFLAVPDVSIITNHASIDIAVDGIPDISKTDVTLRHHIFSDEELIDIISESISLHNPNYTTLASVPKNEYPYVLMKAQANAYRVIAADTAKRKGLDSEASTFLDLANDLEDQYARDRKRQERIIPAPKADESKMGAGDVVSGMCTRRSLRAGYTSSYRNALPPIPPNLYDSADDDVEDTTVRLRWSQNRDQDFSYYEVWRDTQPNVDRSVSGRLANAWPSNSAATGGGPDLPISTQYSRASTAKQVLGVSAGANRISPIFDGFFFWTAAELSGSNIVNSGFIDGLLFNNPGSGVVDILGEPLEPDTDYYYRVYAVNWNGEVVPSKVLKTHTKQLRAKFKRIANGVNSMSNAQNGVLDPNAISPVSGSIGGGTTITIQGNYFSTTGLQILINGKQCSNVIVSSPTLLTCKSPTFVNPDWIGQKVDVVLLSQNGLKDMVLRGWSFTP
jgi:hypothetical protein